MPNLTVEGIPGRWGRANVVAKQKGAEPTTKQILEILLSARASLGEEELAA
jgi:hypothetical protein